MKGDQAKIDEKKKAIERLVAQTNREREERAVERVNKHTTAQVDEVKQMVEKKIEDIRKDLKSLTGLVEAGGDGKSKVMANQNKIRLLMAENAKLRDQHRLEAIEKMPDEDKKAEALRKKALKDVAKEEELAKAEEKKRAKEVEAKEKRQIKEANAEKKWKAKEANAVTRAKSGYQLWLTKEKRDEIIESLKAKGNSQPTFGDIAKAASEAWNALTVDERMAFKGEAAELKGRSSELVPGEDHSKMLAKLRMTKDGDLVKEIELEIDFQDEKLKSSKAAKTVRRYAS